MQEKTIEIDGNKIRYLESGNASETIVLIHGLGASAERWTNVIPILEKNYRVIVPDLIGFGYSDKPSTDYTSDFFSEFLSNFLQHLNLKNIFLIGSSLGGQITAEYASFKNNVVKKLVLVSPSGIMKHSTPALDAYIMAALYPSADGAKTAFEMMSGGTREIDPQVINGFVERMQLPNAKLAFMSTLLGLTNAEIITPKLQQISAPTLIVWGEKDPVIPIKYADSFVSSIQDCRFFRMDNCGHTPYVEDPSTFASLVLDFIKGKT